MGTPPAPPGMGTTRQLFDDARAGGTTPPRRCALGRTAGPSALGLRFVPVGVPASGGPFGPTR
jgi:hypothetical protein